MGSNICTMKANEVKEFVDKQFQESIVENKRVHLILSDILKIKLFDDLKFNVRHIGNLYLLDHDKDGRISSLDAQNFASLVIGQIRNVKPHEIQSKIQAFTSYSLYKVNLIRI